MPPKKPDDVPREMLSGRVDKELCRELKGIAFKEDRNFYLVLEEAVREYVLRKKAKEKQRGGRPG